MKIEGYALETVGRPLVSLSLDAGELHAGEALVEVRGCGVCHTDLGYLFDGVPLRGSTPRILGHEIAGVVVAAGDGAPIPAGTRVVVPAVMPCGECDACRRGRTGICPRQVFVGNDIHGGFASHVKVPARFLCRVEGVSDEALPDLAVVADAVTTPLNAVVRSELAAGQVAVFIGAGGVGAFGVMLAKAAGARVIAIDVDAGRLDTLAGRFADATVDVTGLDPGAVKKRVRELVKSHGWPTSEWCIFETSGTAAGQRTAFALLNHGATLMVVGYTTDAVDVRLSNLMAFEARALGVWGCPPELYPRAVDHVRRGDIELRGFVERKPMAEVNEVLRQVHERAIRRRVVLIP